MLPAYATWIDFITGVRKNNIYGNPFHPEKPAGGLRVRKLLDL